jgi:hypothetical protein
MIRKLEAFREKTRLTPRPQASYVPACAAGSRGRAPPWEASEWTRVAVV